MDPEALSSIDAEEDDRSKPQDDDSDGQLNDNGNLNGNKRPAAKWQNTQSLREVDERTKPSIAQDDKHHTLCRRISSLLLDTRLAMVALLIALLISILLGGGVPDEVVRSNTVLQAQIKQISLALEKQGNQINELADTNNRVFRTQHQSTLFTSLQPVSCKDIKAAHPSSPTGYYYPNGRMVYCNMDKLCGSIGGWTRLAYLNMSDSTESCPSGFKLYQSGGVRACGRPNDGCVSVTFPSNGITYSHVCGRVVGYQYGSADAVDSTHGTNEHNNINSYYVDGISITCGSSRNHVWTLMAGLHEASYHVNGGFNCPCSNGTQNVQSFIGNDYFCESGNPATDGNFQETLYVSDPLWDGEGCGPFEKECCSAPGLPWFNKVLHATTTDYLELRVCGDEPSDNEDIPVSFYEIYVK